MGLLLSEFTELNLTVRTWLALWCTTPCPNWLIPKFPVQGEMGVITIYFAGPAIFVTWLCSLPFEQDWLAGCQHRAESMGVATHEHRTAAPSLPFLVAGFNTSA